MREQKVRRGDKGYAMERLDDTIRPRAMCAGGERESLEIAARRLHLSVLFFSIWNGECPECHSVAVSHVDGVEVVALYANVGAGRRQFSQNQINRMQANIEGAGGVFIHTSGDVHAEQALYQAFGNAPAIGISNFKGPCAACIQYFQQKGFPNLFWPNRP